MALTRFNYLPTPKVLMVSCYTVFGRHENKQKYGSASYIICEQGFKYGGDRLPQSKIPPIYNVSTLCFCPMLATSPSPIEVVHLSGISWQTYETLLEELSDRRLRLTYNRGNLEIMTPSPEHELGKEVLGRFVETIAEELEVQIYPLGSTTFKRPELIGAEPDKCFYIRNIALVRGKKRLNLDKDPAPDLVVEIDVTSSSSDRLQVYADLGITEVWIYNGELLVIKQLQNAAYINSQTSQFFPNVPIPEIAGFLQQAETIDYLELVKIFRQWVRKQIG